MKEVFKHKKKYEIDREYTIRVSFLEIYNENIKKLGFFNGIDEICSSKKNTIAIINLIKYKQSFVSETNNIERVNNKLLEFSKIIKMDHIF
jgi:hypothetical protein